MGSNVTLERDIGGGVKSTTGLPLPRTDTEHRLVAYDQGGRPAYDRECRPSIRIGEYVIASYHVGGRAIALYPGQTHHRHPCSRRASVTSRSPPNTLTQAYYHH